jgi:hypothetical protein
MGIDSSALQFLCAAKHRGVDFRDMLAIGRQGFFPGPKALSGVFKALGVDLDAKAFLEENKFAEPYFKLLGAETIDSMDYSDYEGAAITHDLNKPIPPELRNRFGVVYDGGTLEHIFNFPQAFKSLMEMVRVGGWLIQATTGNNFMGHGFWQVSPELVYSCLSPENGFEVDCVFLKELPSDNAWRLVKDPAKARRRVELINQVPTYLATIARKTADVEVFAKTPQQNDYVALWEAKGNAPWAVRKPRSYNMRRLADELRPSRSTVYRALKALRLKPEYPSTVYRRIDSESLIRGKFDA